MLDPADGLALCLARDGDPLPVEIIETETSFGIPWDASYRIDGELFAFTDRSGRFISVAGYPTKEVARATARIR